MDVESAVGSQLFARYAYPPNELGYCGADGHDELLSAVARARERPGEAAREIRARARSFDGAWVYLELLADRLGLRDPLDQDVVEAYWLGGALLDRVDPGWMRERMLAFLAEQPGGQWAHGLSSAEAADASFQPVHAFHVFRVYPWAALLGRGGDVPVDVLDGCRIRVGVVRAIEGDHASVETDRLTWDGQRLDVEPERLVVTRWRSDHRSLRAGLGVGDLVTLHWGWLCDLVTDEQAAWVHAAERVQLDAVNSRRPWATG